MIRNSILVAAVTLAALGSGVTTVFAQDTAPATRVPDATATPAPRQKTPTRTLKEVLKRLQEGAGPDARVTADSTLLGVSVPLPADPTTPANLDSQLAALAGSLPKGTVWAKLYLPAADAHAYKGDDLSDFAVAQSRLFGTVVGTPSGSVEVLGRMLPADKAQAVIDALNLKPVYLLSNPQVKAVAGGDAAAWLKLTDEQKGAFAKTEAQKRLNMGPEAFGKEFSSYVGQQAAVMGQMFQMMTPEQRDSYRQAMMDSFRNSGGNMMWGRGGMGGPPRGNGGLGVPPAPIQ